MLNVIKIDSRLLSVELRYCVLLHDDWVCLLSGPAEALFQREYYTLLKAALRTGGMLISQGHTFHTSHCESYCYQCCSCVVLVDSGDCAG